MTGQGAASGGLPARRTHDGVVLAVRLTPKASSDEVAGVAPEAGGGPALKVRVRAAPEKGKANASLISTIADWLGVANTQCRLVSGGKSRLKQVQVRGEPDALMARLASRLANPG